MIPACRHAESRGTITELRIGFGNAGPGRVVVPSFHTASDTRQSVNNLNFIRGCCRYVLRPGDVEFLREQLGRIHAAMRFVEREFRPRERNCNSRIGLIPFAFRRGAARKVAVVRLDLRKSRRFIDESPEENGESI
jgi:hypothetical protein